MDRWRRSGLGHLVPDFGPIVDFYLGLGHRGRLILTVILALIPVSMGLVGIVIAILP
jgi:hypothetical protein